jgi:DNA (cytosine-5)-methyltransferase 1
MQQKLPLQSSQPRRLSMYSSNHFPVISLFTGAGGLDLGLDEAGFSIRIAVEIDKWCRKTLDTNRHHFRYPDFALLDDITAYSPGEILSASGLRRGEAALVAGGPPCQSFSTAGRRGSIGDPRGTLFSNFAAVVAEAEPRFFVFENVRGILSAAIKHRPIGKRGPGFPPLAPEEERGSAFRVIRQVLEEGLGYQVIHAVVDAADYGVPQNRQRVIILGSRDHEFGDKTVPEIVVATHRGRWRTLADALADLQDDSPEYLKYTPEREQIMRIIPEGKNWRWLRDHPTFGRGFAEEVMGGAWDAGGGKVGFFRRLSWAKPSPTLPTSPIQKSTSLCHPEETRPLTVKEYAAIQQFPPTYEFAGGTSQKYKQIGNAVPVGLGRAIGSGLMKLLERIDQPALDLARA